MNEKKEIKKYLESLQDPATKEQRKQEEKIYKQNKRLVNKLNKMFRQQIQEAKQ